MCPGSISSPLMPFLNIFYVQIAHAALQSHVLLSLRLQVTIRHFPQTEWVHELLLSMLIYSFYAYASFYVY